MSAGFNNCDKAKTVYKENEIVFDYPEFVDQSTKKTMARFTFVNRPRSQNSSEFYKRYIKITKQSKYSLFYDWVKSHSQRKKDIIIIVYKSNCEGQPIEDGGNIHEITLQKITSLQYTSDPSHHRFDIPDEYTGPVSLKIKINQFKQPPSKLRLRSNDLQSNIKEMSIEEDQ